MAPSRSRKRDSTLKTVELLNNVGNANNDRSLRSRVLNQPRRKLNTEAQGPRSDDIWGVPTSPEQSWDIERGQVPDSDPTTLRRSARGRGRQVHEGVSMLDRHSPTDGNDEEEGDKGEDREDGGNQEIEEAHQGDNQGQEDNGDKDDNMLYMFSDDEDHARRSSQNSRHQWESQESPELLSPSALIDGLGLSSNDAHEAGQEHTTTSHAADLNDENTRISTTMSRERSTHNHSGALVEVQLPDRSSQISDQGSDSSSLFVRQETHDHTEPEPEQDHGVRLNHEQDDAISLFEPEEFQNESSSPSDESATFSELEVEEYMQPQSNKRRCIVQDAPSRIRSRGSQMRPRESLEEPGNLGCGDKGDHEADAAHAAIEEDKARGLQWMQDAMNLGHQRKNWLVLTSTAKELKRMADLSMADSFVDTICTVVRGLRDLYGEMVDGPAPTTATLTQCDKLFSSASEEAEKLLDQAYYQATADPYGHYGESRGDELMAEFEAWAVPDMVKLAIACFHVYYADRRLFHGVFDHFHRVLILLQKSWNRITSMKVQQIVRGVKHDKGTVFRRALAEITQALEAQALRRRPKAREPLAGLGGTAPADASQGQQTGKRMSQHETGKEWSHDEGLALLDGLQLYQGMFCFGPLLRDKEKRRVRPALNASGKSNQSQKPRLLLV